MVKNSINPVSTRSSGTNNIIINMRKLTLPDLQTSEKSLICKPFIDSKLIFVV